MYNVNRIKAFNTSEFSVVTQIALSIQGVLDCVTVGDCDGGSLTDAFTHFVEHGARLLDFNEEGVSIDDDTAPTGKKGSCKERGGKGIRALTWDFALPRNPLLVPKSKASIRCIKEALLEYGALAVEITADPEEKFRNYRRGVYKKDCRLATNHFVLLTGWDDDRDAWIILNSFGRNWGSSCVDVAKVREHFPWTIDNVRNFLVPDRGCMYIKRGVSNVGKMAVWIETGLDNEEWLKKARRFKARQQAEEQRFFESLNSGPGKQAARKR